MKLAPKSGRPGLSSLNMDLSDSDGAPPQGQQIQTLRGWPERDLRAPLKAPSAREQLLQAGQGLHRGAAPSPLHMCPLGLQLEGREKRRGVQGEQVEPAIASRPPHHAEGR